MKYFLTFLLLGLLSTRSLAQISQYDVFFAQYQNELVIRKWKETGAIKYLVVNPENLKTHILNNIEAQPVTWNNVLNLFEKTLKRLTLIFVRLSSFRKSSPYSFLFVSINEI